jgi:hypothetical protein
MMENAGKVIDSLKLRPDFIMLVVLQMVTMYLIYAGIGVAVQQRQERELILLNRCLDKTDALIKEN